MGVGVSVVLTSPVSVGRLAIGVAGEVFRVLVRARFGVEDVEMMLSELGGLFLASLLGVWPSRTQYRNPFLRTQSEGLSLL